MARMKYGLIGEITDFDYHGMWGDYCSPKSLKAVLDGLAANDELEIEVNSPGGSVVQGIEMANAIKNSKAKVIAHVTGIAASMASVIVCACDEIEMEEASFMMIHDPWGYAEGNAEEMRKQASVLDQMKAVIMSFYRGKFTKCSEEQIAALMSDETWYTGNECLENGLDCTVIASDIRAAASIVGHKFAKMPEGAAKFLTAKEITPEGKAEIDAARQAAKADATLVAAVPPRTAEGVAAVPPRTAEGAVPPRTAEGVAAVPPRTAEGVAAVPPRTAEGGDWEARYKGASKKITELKNKLADVEDTAKCALEAMTAKFEAAEMSVKNRDEAIAERDKTISEFQDQVKNAGYENLAAIIDAVSGLKADLEARAKDLADTREQLDHMKETRDLLTGSVLSAKTETYADRMSAAKTPEERESLRAMKRAGKIK